MLYIDMAVFNAPRPNLAASKATKYELYAAL